MNGSFKDTCITHETHTIIFTNSRKRASGLTPSISVRLFLGNKNYLFLSCINLASL